MGLKENVGFMGLTGLMGLMGIEDSLLLLVVSVWVVWWLRVVAVRSVVFVFSRSVMVVSLVVSPVSLVWIRMVVVSLSVSWRVRVTTSRRVSWTVSLRVCCVTVLLLLQLTVNRASVTMRAVVNPLYCISQMGYFGS